MDDFIARSTEYLFDNDIFLNVGNDDDPEIGFRPAFIQYLEDRNRHDILDRYQRRCPMGWILREANFSAEEAVEIKLKFEL
ncbi:hypothetical protein D3C72_267510 [compost metagenome]